MAGTACVVAACPSPGIVGRAREAATRWLIRKLAGLGFPVYILTPDPASWADLGVEVRETPAQGFRLGPALAGLVRELAPPRLLYFSAGSGFLLEEADILSLAELDFPRPFAVFNNFYSTDFALLVPPEPGVLEALPGDNALGWICWRAGYRCFELPRSAKTQLDIDTPGELQILTLWEDLPGEIGKALYGLSRARAEALLGTLVSPEGRLFLAGRVSGHLLRYLERGSACRTQALIEGRGMKAEGLPVRSLLRELLEARGPRGLVASMAAVGDVVVWDVRTLFGAVGIWPDPEERFSFDLLEVDGLRTPLLVELAAAVREAPATFLLGGHSLVSGAMYLAVELAWRRTPRGSREERLKRLEVEDERIVEIRPRGSG